MGEMVFQSLGDRRRHGEGAWLALWAQRPSSWVGGRKYLASFLSVATVGLGNPLLVAQVTGGGSWGQVLHSPPWGLTPAVGPVHCGAPTCPHVPRVPQRSGCAAWGHLPQNGRGAAYFSARNSLFLLIQPHLSHHLGGSCWGPAPSCLAGD